MCFTGTAVTPETGVPSDGLGARFGALGNAWGAIDTASGAAKAPANKALNDLERRTLRIARDNDDPPHGVRTLTHPYDSEPVNPAHAVNYGTELSER